MNTVIFVAQGVQDQEFFYPYYRLKEIGNVDVVVSGKTNITGKYGIPIKDIRCTTKEFFNMGFYTVNSKEYDLVIIPGGWQAPEIMRQDTYLLEYIRQASKKDILIGSICHGPQVLISAGICEDVEMTCYKGMKDDLINARAICLDKPVVCDKNIITSPHYDNNPEWMKAIIAKLDEKLNGKLNKK